MNQRVLMIDDSLPLHTLVQAQFEAHNMLLYSAYDGESGLSSALSVRPGVILLDVDLPQMDGFEVCRRLKSSKETSLIPVTFLTADFATVDKVKALDLGAVDYVTKPFKADELSARVRATLRTRHEIDQRGMIDGLTGLWNRTYLMDHLKAQLSLAARNGRPLSCIVADVDGLGRINDKHGRGVGDEVIRTVGQLLLSQCRAEDAVCNTGGGKFSILSSGTDRHAAGKLADRLCSQARKTAVRKGMEVGVTCSFGVADISVAGDEPLFDRADGALTRAKMNGPGTVCVARPPRASRAVAA